ncbi:NACHT domain-containing protein [Pectobacterium carotovorum subsp. carotovorum]|uniref:NACHT domain-containing protein n=1 Tax=Pectobacterium carotovorum TaxID=554 RepID=UPI00202D1F8C|nr:NACHT domain-containing protein [Pectobacterium carotovorum]MCL6328937.1 NACHT domain-containing protein [Pectobacterium carotovorum subsp. carotovorum]
MDSLVAQMIVSGSSEVVKVLAEKCANHFISKTQTADLSIIKQFLKEDIQRKYIQKHIARVQKIRTIHSPEADILLEDIYYPLCLTVSSNKDKVSIEDGQVINYSGIANIIGIAGQGKSTIARKLFIEEIKLGNRFPFFIELRRLTNGNIIESLSELLKDCGVECNIDNVSELLSSGIILLILDGFDEVLPNSRLSVLNQIRVLNDRCSCSIISTSRPDTEICHDSGINNLYVDKLKENDVLGILKKISNQVEYNDLCQIINRNESLKETLVTPILVNLLYICYPYWDSVPTNMVEFYNRLFSTLYYRHDKLKLYARPRKSTVSAVDSYWCFNAICFHSHFKGEYDFTEEQLVEYAKNALRSKNINIAEATCYLEDICNITCLIQNDGFDRYVFLHKSIQEFHAAFFISKMPFEKKSIIYKRFVSEVSISDKNNNVIKFLKYIDDIDFKTLFTIEVYHRSMIVDPDGNFDINTISEIFDFYIDNTHIDFTPFDGDVNISGVRSRSWGGSSVEWDYEIALSILNGDESAFDVFSGFISKCVFNGDVFNIETLKNLNLFEPSSHYPTSDNRISYEDFVDGKSRTVSITFREWADTFYDMKTMYSKFIEIYSDFYFKQYVEAKKGTELIDKSLDEMFKDIGYME